MIFTLIQALYDPRITFPRDSDFYVKVLEDIEFFTISSQVYCLLKQRGQLELTPAFFQERLKQNYDKSLFPNLLIKHQTEQISKRFEESGIPVIPIKGAPFAEKYFGHIGGRGTSDIDLLIKHRDLERAIRCVKSLGYTYEEKHIPSHFHWSFSRPLPNSPISLTVELHWDLLKENTSDLNIDEFWEQATPLGSYRYIKELSDYHMFYLICLHGWRHNLDSMKYFIDIIQMIHVLQDKLRYDVLFRDATTHKTLKRITRVLAIVYHHFPHLETMKELPSPKRTRLWWDYHAIRDTSDRSFKHYLNLIYYEFHDFDTFKHSLSALSMYLFPSMNRKTYKFFAKSE